MTNSVPKAGSAELSQLLEDMNERGGFPVSVLTDRNGFTIAAAAAPGQDPEMQAAAVALVQKTSAQVRDQLSMAPTDEISVYDATGKRLVCRPFKAGSHDMILAVLVPERAKSYRRLTNSTVDAVRRLWKLS